ncbi:ferritin-like domain-containing protein [Zobellia uliginosa]|uniref:ferritin-like domain-containing protein n=1 Tax=Zobellia uliginosa TaxID=143224 RepID=UPI0026E1642A|nr:PA2169 family four-helix-bundle protein [Zobellia uliginosa]MDO6518733.1 PA2169 family four-helix-bundle protein [Zobellia uliginosa]
MNSDIKEIEESINDIIQKNEDAIKGYDQAVENSKEIGLKSYFQNKAIERRNFLLELKAATPALKTREEVEGSVTGALHRTWMDVKTFFSGDNDKAMLEEAIRGDKAAIDEYNEVLADTHLPLKAAAVIRKQRDWLLDDLKTIKTLEDVR